ncbi:MAG: Rpn family recombination-promoting nuclease/putative transposase [Lachnospiraceae bacterium]
MYKKTMKDLHLTERFLFAEAMEDPVISKNILEIIMEKSIHLLSRIETEKELRSSEFLRSVRLDMFALDDEDNVYNAEMQKVKEGDLVRRSRYYQAMIDHSLLIPGEKEFGDLNNSYMILIMPFDLFGSGKFVSVYQMTCINDSNRNLEDGATRIFVNTYGKNKEDVTPEFIELMQYINETREEVASRCKSPRVREIHKHLERIRSNEEVGVRWLQEWEEKLKFKKDGIEEGLRKGLEKGREVGRKEGREEGRKEGREQGIKALIITSFKLGAADDVVISELTELFHLTRDEAQERISRYRKSV